MATIGALTSNSYTVLQLLRGDESRREAVDKLCRQHPLQRVRVISVDTQSSGRSLALSQQLDLISTQREHRSLRRRVCRFTSTLFSCSSIFGAGSGGIQTGCLGTALPQPECTRPIGGKALMWISWGWVVQGHSTPNSATIRTSAARDNGIRSLTMPSRVAP